MTKEQEERPYHCLKRVEESILEWIEEDRAPSEEELQAIINQQVATYSHG